MVCPKCGYRDCRCGFQHPWEENTMSKLAQAEEMERRAERILRAADKLREEYEKFGDDDFEDGTVLAFEKSFGGSGSFKYSYVAFKVKGNWYLSGRDAAKWSWIDLVDFMNGTEHLYIVTAWEAIF